MILENIERLAPQWFIAFIVILIAIAIFIYRDPVYNLCDAQKQAYINTQKDFLASQKYQKFFKLCLRSNNAGGCEPYFKGFKTVLDDLKVVDNKCIPRVVGHPRVKGAMNSFLIQTVRLAWGDKGPESIYGRASWLSAGHLQVFCRVKSGYEAYYGAAAYKRLESEVLEILPNKRKLRQEQVRDRSLFAVSCYKYF